MAGVDADAGDPGGEIFGMAERKTFFPCFQRRFLQGIPAVLPVLQQGICHPEQLIAVSADLPHEEILIHVITSCNALHLLDGAEMEIVTEKTKFFFPEFYNFRWTKTVFSSIL